MKAAMARALLDAQQEARPVVLLTPLDGSTQRLLGEAQLQLMALTDQALADECRKALQTDRAVVLALQGTEVLITPHNPPLRLIIVGAVHISESLCTMASAAGYQVTVVDPRSAFLRPERFPSVQLLDLWPTEAFAKLQPDARTAVVLLTHDPKIDDPALQSVLASPAFYIGALGSTRTHAKRQERLQAAGVKAEALARIHGPAGLSIHARTPAEIAISVLAQMTQLLRSA
jgi:xanthine dehydrogenase accessory factor